MSDYQPKEYHNIGRTLTWGRDLTAQEMDALRGGEVFTLQNQQGAPHSQVVMDSYGKIREMRVSARTGGGVKIKLTVKYEAGHSYDEEWEQLYMHCPNCGKHEVWHSTDDGDYYVGEKYMCRKCGAHFYMPHGVMTGKLDWQDQQRIDALRAVKPCQHLTAACPSPS